MTARPASRIAVIHLLILSALCAAAYLPGLTDHGLTNWQESTRLVVAQEMQRSETTGLATPILHGEPYLAKPPLLYWLQMTIATMRGSEVELFDLRLAVALAGWMGVLATYLAARVMLAPGHTKQNGSESEESAFARTAAFWSAAFVATGILTARAARIGEIDVLLLPATGLGVAAAQAAWSRYERDKRVAPFALAGVVLAAALGTLAKGPAGMVVPLGAVPIAIMMRAASGFGPGRIATIVTLVAGAFIAAGVLTFTTRAGEHAISDYRDVVGVAIHGAGLVGVVVLGVTLIRRAFSGGPFPAKLIPPLLACGLPLAAIASGVTMWLWGEAMRADVGAETLGHYAYRESANNLSLFIPNSSVRALEALAYGAGIGSICALIAGVWLLKDRPRFQLGWYTAVGWLLTSLVYTLSTTGTHRYLLPVLPGVAILGGTWFAAALRDFPIRKQLRIGMGLGVAALAIGQGVWYGYARNRTGYQSRSPDAFVTELIEAHQTAPDDLVTFDFWTGALDASAGQPVEPYSDPATRPVFDFPHVAPNVSALKQRMSDDPERDWTILYRDDGKAENRLRELDFTLARVPVEAEFLFDKFTTPIAAARVKWTPER